MAVQNRIVKVQKRNRALVKFDDTRIRRAIFHAAESIGGCRQDFLPGINDQIFDAYGTDERIAEFLADAVVVCLHLTWTSQDIREAEMRQLRRLVPQWLDRDPDVILAGDFNLPSGTVEALARQMGMTPMGPAQPDEVSV